MGGDKAPVHTMRPKVHFVCKASVTTNPFIFMCKCAMYLLAFRCMPFNLLGSMCKKRIRVEILTYFIHNEATTFHTSVGTYLQLGGPRISRSKSQHLANLYTPRCSVSLMMQDDPPSARECYVTENKASLTTLVRLLIGHP